MLMSASIKRNTHIWTKHPKAKSEISKKTFHFVVQILWQCAMPPVAISLAEPYCSPQASDKRVPKAGNLWDLSKRSLPILHPLGRTVSKDEGVTHQVGDAAERYRLAFFADGPAAPALAHGTSTAAIAVIGQSRNSQSSCYLCSEGCGYMSDCVLHGLRLLLFDLHLENYRQVLLPQHLLGLLRQDPAASRL